MKFIVKKFSQPWQDKFDTFARVARPRLTLFRRFTPRRTRATPFARATLSLDSPSTRGSQPPLAFRAAECVCHGPYKDGPLPLGGGLILLLHHHHPSFPVLRLLLRCRRPTTRLTMARSHRKRRSSSADVDARFARAEAEGCVAGAHREQDMVQNASRHNRKTKKDQDRGPDVIRTVGGLLYRERSSFE